MNNEVIGSLTLKTYDEIENTISLLCELAIRHHRQIAAVESENEVDEFAESTRAHYLEKAKKHLSTY